MTESANDSPLLLCTSCGKPHEPGRHLCEHCGAPLTAHAHSDWVLGIASRGFAAHRATTEPRKLIVVIGMWLWLFPLLAFGIGISILGLAALRDALAGQRVAAVGAIILLAIGVGFASLASAILWRTTGRYFAQRSNHDRWPSGGRGPDIAGDDDSAEPMECLGCGQSFPGDAERCPSCGWSFRSPN